MLASNKTERLDQSTGSHPAIMMHSIGRDASIPDLQRQRMKRVKRGECAECGTPLFKKSMLRKATALTVKGKCWNGRCLLCFPLNALEQEQAARRIPIPKEIVTCCTTSPAQEAANHEMTPEEQLTKSVGNFVFDMDDDVSAITLDRRIRTESDLVDQCGAATGPEEDGGAHGEAAEDDDSAAQRSLRKRMAGFLEEAVGSQLDIMAKWEAPPEQAPPRPTTRGVVDKSNVDEIQVISDLLPESARPPRPSEVPKSDKHKKVFKPHMYVPPVPTEEDSYAHQTEIRLETAADTRPESTTANKDSSDASMKEISFDASLPSPSTIPVQKVPINFRSSSGGAVSSAPAAALDEASYTETGESFMALMELSVTHNHDDDDDDDLFMEDPNRLQLDPAGADHTLECPDGSMRKLPPSVEYESGKQPATAVSPKRPSTSEFQHSFCEIKESPIGIELLLSELKRSGNAEDHTVVLHRLTEYLWIHGEMAKRDFVAASGLQTLTSTMWVDMMIPRTVTAIAELFLALVSRSAPQSTPTEENDALCLTREDTEGLIDALLIAMQTLIMDEGVQQSGCRVLCCLASSSSNSHYETDGSSAGACLTVLNAMDAHFSSVVLQEWGLRALYNQCLHSSHAETNKRTIISSQLNTTGATGGEVVERLIVQYSKSDENLRDGGVLEWACRLFWCLTASHESVSEMISLHIDALRELLHMLEQCRLMEDASVHLQQAVLGMIANLSRMNRYRSFLGTSDVILLILDTIHTNKQYVEVQIEACNVISNISGLLSPVERDEIVDSGAVRTIVGAIFAFSSENMAIQEPALRALVALTHKSEIAKEDVCEHDTLLVLMQLCRLNERSTLSQQEMLCSLIASIYASERLQPKAIKCDTFGALTAAMATYSKSETIQCACLTAYRNLSKQNLENLARGSEVCLAVNAMITFRMNNSIQNNACCVLWNMGVGTKFGHQKIAQTKAVERIVNAIQTHLDAPEIVDTACGALWGLIHQSQSLRQQFLDVDGGVEAIACTLVMHGESVGILEKACGVLAICTADPHATAVAASVDGVTSMVETMRNNPRSVQVLQYGAHFLRNTVKLDRRYVGAAEGAISVLVSAMKVFTQADPLLKEACYFLWTMSELSADSKSKIIALDGESTLLWILDHRGGNKGIEDAALGAFQELALVPSN